ncbi:MAG: glycosyltransferase family 4 protein [Acetobacteraceae bacterium]|nr:glycosyltransferase family 4 protein [Acetobacteraceae bacterium]
MTLLPERPLTLTVLPPGEGFGPGRSGAIGLIVRRFARMEPSLVVGGEQTGPVFDDVAFREAVPSRWRLGNVNVRYAAAVARIVRGLRPALVEVHNRPEVALALTARFPSIPVMLVLHNDPQAMRRARTAAERQVLLQRMARVVTVSRFLAGRLMEGIGESGGVPAVLPNPIEFAELPPTPPEREDLIVFAGRVVAEKGADSFVEACTLALPGLPGWEAELIGADRFRADAPETPFVAQVRAAAKAGGVRMVGYRDHPLVLKTLSRAAIAVVPSRWDEPFGLAALEAMACGAALVCSRRGALPEVAGDAAVYVDPEDPLEMAYALIALGRDEERRTALAKAGRSRARRFGLPAAALQLAGLRREVLAAGGSGIGAPLYPPGEDADKRKREQTE